MCRLREFGKGSDLRRRPTGSEAQRRDAVELGLLARIGLGLRARLVALVEHFDLLELLEGLAQRRLVVIRQGF